MLLSRAHFILYVADPARSRDFYRAVLGFAPRLDVPGMTEFELSETSVLGLMPERGILRLLAPSLPDPALANGMPRAELYLVVDSPAEAHARVLAAGGRELAPLERRDWGDLVSYCLDPDGHVLALAGRGGAEAP